jgi:ABC-2 type transport system permease protein
MAVIWTLAKKELRLLLRDPRAAVLLLGMPLLFIFILGLLLGEGFGQNPDKRLRVTVVDLDQGYAVEEGMSWLALTPTPAVGAIHGPEITALALAATNRFGRFPYRKWSDVVLEDLTDTAEIRVEVVPDEATARRLCAESKRPAVIKFGPDFSHRLADSSFLTDGINPFYRDGVRLPEVDAELILDHTQEASAGIIEQVAQVTLFRVILPWMIGKAFEKISQPDFVQLLGTRVRIPLPRGDNALERMAIESKLKKKGVKPDEEGKVTLNEALKVAAPDQAAEEDYQRRVGDGVQSALGENFHKYDLTGKTWAKLTKAEPRDGGNKSQQYHDEGGSGPLHRGGAHYRSLVPMYAVMFTFALTLVVGWLFVSERRRGTLKRLQAAPITRAQVLLGKFLPCLALAVFQGLFLLGAGKLAFGLNWGPESWSLGKQVFWLSAVAVTTAWAAMGLAMLVAALARTEMQVAIYGGVLVLALGLIGGCVVPREWMPDPAKNIGFITPHAWALDAYAQLLRNSEPNLGMVQKSCLMLTGFGTVFLGAAWWFLRLE